MLLFFPSLTAHSCLFKHPDMYLLPVFYLFLPLRVIDVIFQLADPSFSPFLEFLTLNLRPSSATFRILHPEFPFSSRFYPVRRCLCWILCACRHHALSHTLSSISGCLSLLFYSQPGE